MSLWRLGNKLKWTDKEKNRKKQSVFTDLLQMKVNVQREIGKLALQRVWAYNISPFPLFAGRRCRKLYNTVLSFLLTLPLEETYSNLHLIPISSKCPLESSFLVGFHLHPLASHMHALHLFILMLPLKCKRSNHRWYHGVLTIICFNKNLVTCSFALYVLVRGQGELQSLSLQPVGIPCCA